MPRRAHFEPDGLDRLVKTGWKGWPHGNPFDSPGKRYPMPIREIGMTVRIVDSLDIKVLCIGHHAGPAPGDVAILAEDHHRQADQSHSRGAQFRAVL